MELNTIRQFFAEEIRVVGNLRSDELVKAFATVARENFLGPGPWQFATPDLLTGSVRYRPTPDHNPAHLYHNIPVAIDTTRNLPNGQPSAIGFFIDCLDLKSGDAVLHLGCGTGYYTAIMAEVVGASGKIIALEIEDDIAAQARNNLAYLHQVEVVSADGTTYDPGPVDAILVNAGATHPQAAWLDGLKLGGRLIVPLTIAAAPNSMGAGMMLKVKREENGLTAQFIAQVGIYPCLGGRDEEAQNRLRNLMMQGKWRAVQSLRRDAHEVSESCCLHGDGVCLSADPLTTATSSN